MTKFSYQVQLLEAFLKQTSKHMSEGICMRFYEAIVQNMFKHVASENAPLVFSNI